MQCFLQQVGMYKSEKEFGADRAVVFEKNGKKPLNSDAFQFQRLR